MNDTILEKPLGIALRIIALLICGALEMIIAPFKATGKICLILSEEIFSPILGSLTGVIRRLEDKVAESRTA